MGCTYRDVQQLPESVYEIAAEEMRGDVERQKTQQALGKRKRH